MKVAPSPPLTYVCSSMHLSAKKEAQACSQCPRPAPSRPLMQPWRASRDPLTADCHPHHSRPSPWVFPGADRGSVCPSKRKIRSHRAQSRLPWQGGRGRFREPTEPRVAVPVPQRGRPSTGSVSRALPAPSQAGDIHPGPGTRWALGESGEGVFPEERLPGPGPGAAGQGHGVRTDCPRSGGCAWVNGQSSRTDSTPRPPPDQGSGDGLSASNLTLIPSRQISVLTSLRQEHNAFLCEAQALGEGGELFLDLSSGGLGAAWGREEKPLASVGLQHPRSAPAPEAGAPADAPTGGAPGRAVGAAWGTYCTAWPCGSPGPGLGHSRWRAGRRSRSPSPPPTPRGCCSSLETRETAP